MNDFNEFYKQIAAINGADALDAIKNRVTTEGVSNLAQMVSLTLFIQSQTLQMLNMAIKRIDATNQRLNLIEQKIQNQMPNPDPSVLSASEHKMLNIVQEFSHIGFQNDPNMACSIGNLPLLKFTISKQPYEYKISDHPELLTKAFEAYQYQGSTKQEKDAVLAYLFNNGIDITSTDELSGKNILHTSIEKNKKDIIQNLVHHNSFRQLVNQKDNYGNTPLHIACKRNQVDTVRLLLDNGADPNSYNKNKENGLWLTKNPDITRMLLNKGARIYKNSKGSTLLHACIDQHTPQSERVMLEILKSPNINVDETEGRGYTPLKSACMKSEANICRILVQHGANTRHRCLSAEDKAYLNSIGL